MNEEEIQRYFNEVENMTGVCVLNTTWHNGRKYPELEIGKTYKVSHFGVLRSKSWVMVDDFPGRDYDSMCFDLYENGELLSDDAGRDFRFLAPYLKKLTRRGSMYRYSVYMEEDGIPPQLHSIEKEHDIKILLAVEAGSRAQGLESPDSDWDVRYIYIHKPEWYSQTGERRCVIEHLYYNEIDTYGWELKDALSHLRDGNPTLLEWINSPKVYYADESFVSQLKAIGQPYFLPVKAIDHYHQTYTKLNERFVKEDGNLKAFLHYFHGILACRWIEKNGTLPPWSFSELLNATVEDDIIRMMANSLINIKKSFPAKDNVFIGSHLLDYARHLANHYKNLLSFSLRTHHPASSEPLDNLFQEMLKQYERPGLVYTYKN